MSLTVSHLGAVATRAYAPWGHSEALLRARMAKTDAQVAELQAVRGGLARGG